MYKNIGLFLLSFLVIFTSSMAQKPRFGEKKIARNVKKHISFLASDNLEGRATATDGGHRGAEYIAEQFESLGLEQMDGKSYFQTIPIPSLRMAQANSSLMIDGEVYTLFKDFYPISESSNKGQYSGEMINIGFGIEDQGLDQQDYKNKDIKGKTVIINLDVPDSAKSTSKYAKWLGVETRANLAKSKGARAVLFYSKNKEIKPNGTLSKEIIDFGIPIFYVTKDLSKKTKSKGDLEVDILLMTTDAHNVIGLIDNGASHTVIIGANHDHLGRGEKGGAKAEYKGMIHNGADANASGVAALIELARRIKKKSKHYTKYNYLFIAFTGSMQNQMGSKYFTQSELFDAAKTNYMININKIGCLDSSQKMLHIAGVGSSTSWKKSIKSISYPEKKITTFKLNENTMRKGDNYAFTNHKIPSLEISTGNRSFHNTPNDDLDKLNINGEAFIISYLGRLMCELDKSSSFIFTPELEFSE